MTVALTEALAGPIVAKVAEHHVGVSLAALRGRGRQPALVIPRQMFMALALADGRFSSVQVGRLLKRDHKTVLHGAAKHAARLQADYAASRRAWAEDFGNPIRTQGRGHE